MSEIKQFRYLDLFAGAGGLSEGFMRGGFVPVAHVEMDKSACYTLRTRLAYHWLKNHDKANIYKLYLEGTISRDDLYENIPENVLNSVINKEISDETIPIIFSNIDNVIENGGKIDLIIGGPPCQAYSLIGRARNEKKMKNDRRNYLFRYYVLFLQKYSPKYFVFENVVGLLSAKDQAKKSYFEEMIDLFQKSGYSVEYKILNSSCYGVPQNRKRVILVGKKGKQNKDFYPEPEKWMPDITVFDVLRDLPEIKSGQGSVLPCKIEKHCSSWLYEAGIKSEDFPVTWHQARPNNDRDLAIYKKVVECWNNGHHRISYNDLPEKLKTHKNRYSFMDRFKVVAGDLPCSQTIMAHMAKDGHYYIHPDINQNRSLTPREAARLQTFPDDYFFESDSGKYSRTDAFRQIGNAVPVLLAQKIAEKIKEKMMYE